MKYIYKIPTSTSLKIVIASVITSAGMIYIADSLPSSALRLPIALGIAYEHYSKFYWALAILTLLATFFSILIAINMQRITGFVELRSKSALVPKASISIEPIEIPYTSITNIQVSRLKNSEVIQIESTVANSNLVSTYFQSQNEYISFSQLLKSKISSQ